MASGPGRPRTRGRTLIGRRPRRLCEQPLRHGSDSFAQVPADDAVGAAPPRGRCHADRARNGLGIPSRAGFGAVDKLPSGKWRARCTGPDGRRRTSTFSTKSDARVWLSTQHADVVRKTWRAPEAGRRTVGAFAAEYLARGDLRESTRALYSGLWRLHLEETWGSVAVRDVTPAKVRSWHIAASGVTRPTALAQSYRLLRSILSVAVADEVIAANPCKLRNAGIPKPARPSRALTITEVQALADRLGQEARTARYRAACAGSRPRRPAARRGDRAAPFGRHGRRASRAGGPLRSLRRWPMAGGRAEDRRWTADGAPAPSRRRRPDRAPAAVRPRRPRCTGLRHERRDVPPLGQLRSDLPSGRSSGGPPPGPTSRAAAHRGDPGCRDRSEHQRAHAAHGPCVACGRVALPARCRSPRRRDRPGTRRPDGRPDGSGSRRAPGRSRESLGHIEVTWPRWERSVSL